MAWRLMAEKRYTGSQNSNTGYERPFNYEARMAEFSVTVDTEERLESEPSLYGLDEVLTLKHRSPEELREIHKAKLAFPGYRVNQ